MAGEKEALSLPPLAINGQEIVSSGDDGGLDGFSTRESRRLNRKLDLYVLPPFIVIWFVSFIDRVNIGNARIQGLEKDLGMTGNQFNIALVAFFVPFVVFEVPSNMILKKLNRSSWLCIEVLLLAIFTVGQGLVTNFKGLIAMRFLLGIFEGGLVPGCVFFLSQYYPRFDLQWRLNILFAANSLASAFGGLLAYAIAGLSGRYGYLGWRWIFIIEGSITAGAAIIFMPFMVDSPLMARWISHEDRALIKQRVSTQTGTFPMDRLDKAAAFRCFSDWKIWINVFIYFGTISAGYNVNLFAPTFVAEMHPDYSARRVQALVIPIFVVSAAAALLTAIASDRLKHRFGFAMLGYVISLVGWIILNSQSLHTITVEIKYMALYFINVGAYITTPTLWTILANNVSGRWKASIASGMQIGLGSSGAIVASLIFPKEEAPVYHKGNRVSMSMVIMAAALMTVYVLGLRLENKKRERGERDYRLDGNTYDIDNLGDDHPRFRFVY